MINYLKHAKPLENEDQTNDEEIVSRLRTYTSKPMPIIPLKRYLREKGLLYPLDRSGSLIEFADAELTPAELKHAVRVLTEVCLDNREEIDTTQGEDAQTFYAGLIGLQQAGALDNDESIDHVANVLELAGGLKYPELEVSELVEARAKYQLEQKFSDLLNTISGAMETEMSAEESTIETIRQVAVDAANNWSE